MRILKRFKNFINYIGLYFSPHLCPICHKKSGNLSIGQAMMWGGMGGRCFECVNTNTNTCNK